MLLHLYNINTQRYNNAAKMEKEKSLSAPIVVRAPKQTLNRIYKIQAQEIMEGMREDTNASAFIRDAVNAMLEKREKQYGL